MLPIRSLAYPVLRNVALPLALTALCMTSAPARAQGASEPWVAPDRASQRANPVASAPDVVKNGHKIFVRECEQCHGKLAHGDGSMAPALNVRPKNLTSDAVTSQTDGALFWKISEGRGLMPKANLTDTEKWTVIQYLRTLPPHNP
jgi:mono/diheme cytochrome c family protein